MRARSDKFQMPQNTTIPMADSRNVHYNKDRIHLRMVPFTSEIRDWENLHDVESFKIVDTQGRVVISQKVHRSQYSVDVSKLARGSYVLHIYDTFDRLDLKKMIIVK